MAARMRVPMLLLGGLLLGDLVPAGAAPRGAQQAAQPPSPAAMALTQAGEQALSVRDFATALSSLEQAYRLWPSPLLFDDLAQTAIGQRRVVAAADLWRRYLEEVGSRVPDERRAEIERCLGAPRPPADELTVAGERGALLWVDDRLAGALPLSLPLLVAAGQHQLRLEKGPQRVETQVLLPAGRQAEVRFTFAPAVALVRLMQAVLLRVECRGGPPDLPARLERAVAAALRQEHAVLVRPPPAAPPGPRSARGSRATPALCPDPVVCGEQDALRAEAQLVLLLQANAGAGGLRVAASLRDVAAAAEAAHAELSCGEWGDKDLQQRLGPLLKGLLLDATTRARGTLAVTATDASAAGAAVQVDGRALGALPLQREAFAGPHVLRVERPGYLPSEEVVTVAENETSALAVHLRKPPPPPPRPLRAAGWILGGAGLAAVVTGAVLWGLDGRLKRGCSPNAPNVCTEEWDGLPAGLPVLVPGVVVLGAAGLLLGLDARAHREAPVAPALALTF